MVHLEWSYQRKISLKTLIFNVSITRHTQNNNVDDLAEKRRCIQGKLSHPPRRIYVILDRYDLHSCSSQALDRSVVGVGGSIRMDEEERPYPR